MSSYITIAEKVLRDEAQSILRLIPNLDDNFDRVVTLILSCSGKVVVTGVGKSGLIGAKIAATLSSTGTPAFFSNPLDIYHGDLGVITNTDVVVAISNSGNTDELLRFIPYIVEEKIPLIAITGNPNSILARHSTCVLNIHVDEEACPLNLAPTSSTTATLAMGDALACALIKARDFHARDFARFHPGGSIGHRLLTTAADVMRTDELPIISPQLPLGEAIVFISRCRLGLGVAVDDNNTIQGIITDGDLRRAIERHGAQFYNIPVSEVMSRNPICVNVDVTVGQILSLMNQKKIHAVLVTSENRNLLGIVDSFACGE